jgi:hypothetical protein
VVLQLLDVPMLQLVTTMLLLHVTMAHVNLLLVLVVPTQQHVTTIQLQPSITVLVYILNLDMIVTENVYPILIITEYAMI